MSSESFLITSKQRPIFTWTHGVNWYRVWEIAEEDRMPSYDLYRLARLEESGLERAAEAEAWFEDFRARHGLK